MDVNTLTVPRDEAVKMLRKYKEHKAYQTPVDLDVIKIYEAIEKGKLVVNALASIVKAGLDPKTQLPKLAIARADEKVCYIADQHRQGCTMAGMEWITGQSSKTRYFTFPDGTFPGINQKRHRALVPHIPPEHRPKRGIQNYHILWEADWQYAPPVDPMLLRRLGKDGDIWLVVAVWDLTDVERAVMDIHKPPLRR